MIDRLFHMQGVLPVAVGAFVEVSIFALRTNLCPSSRARASRWSSGFAGRCARPASFKASSPAWERRGG